MQGGIARLLSEIVRNSRHTVDWRILTNAAGPAEPAVLRGPPAALIVSLPSQVRWLKAADEAFVACGHLKLLPLALVVGRLAGVRVGTIVYGRELIPRRTLHHLAAHILRRSDRVIAISAYTARAARQCGAVRHRTRIVLPILRPSWSGRQPSSRPSDEGLRLIALTRLAEGYKNLEVLFRMVKVLSTTGIVERLTVVGGGPRLPALRAKVKRLGITHLISFTGPVDDETLTALLAKAHVGVFPSRRSFTEAGFEGFGLAIQELAAAGLPVIVGGCAGALDAALPEWSMVVDPDDLRAWVDAVAWLAANEHERMRMGEAAATWAESVDETETARLFVEAIRA
jgi:glycosyltransferase involved in cell wall biosynthesis